MIEVVGSFAQRRLGAGSGRCSGGRRRGGRSGRRGSARAIGKIGVAGVAVSIAR